MLLALIFYNNRYHLEEQMLVKARNFLKNCVRYWNGTSPEAERT